MSKLEPMLWLSDARGIYIPRDFALSFSNRAFNVFGVDDDTWAILEAGPDHELYWEAWDDVCRDCVVTDDKGQRMTVYQNGDCWLIPDGMEWSDKEDFFCVATRRNRRLIAAHVVLAGADPVRSIEPPAHRVRVATTT